jgi:hypothetical protein
MYILSVTVIAKHTNAYLDIVDLGVGLRDSAIHT